jgi:hypothetical protein
MLFKGFGGVLSAALSDPKNRRWVSCSLYLSSEVFFMPESEDIWPKPAYETAPPKHLHALGVISLNFNLFETSMYVLLEQFMPESAVAYFFHEMSNEKRMSALRAFSQSHADPDITERIDSICTYFSICAENRNLLMHSRIEQLRSADLLSLTKMGKSGELSFDLPLGILRRVADEMWMGIKFTFDFAKHLAALRESLTSLVNIEPDAGPKFVAAVQSLPEIPPKPHKLDPHLRLLSPPDGPLQPRSSRA